MISSNISNYSNDIVNFVKFCPSKLWFIHYREVEGAFLDELNSNVDLKVKTFFIYDKSRFYIKKLEINFEFFFHLQKFKPLENPWKPAFSASLIV